MARPIRVEYAGASYHVMARGNERKEIYRGEEDRRMFLVALEKMVERFAVRLYGCVLMPNHFHLLLTCKCQESRVDPHHNVSATSAFRNPFSGYNSNYKSNISPNPLGKSGPLRTIVQNWDWTEKINLYTGEEVK